MGKTSNGLYSSPSLRGWLGFLHFSAGLQMRSADLTLTFAHQQFGSHHRALCFLWSLCWYRMLVKLQCACLRDDETQRDERWLWGTNPSLASVKNTAWRRQGSWIVSSTWPQNLNVSFASGMSWSLFQSLWGKEGMKGFYWKQWPKERFCCHYDSGEGFYVSVSSAYEMPCHICDVKEGQDVGFMIRAIFYALW